MLHIEFFSELMCDITRNIHTDTDIDIDIYEYVF